MIESFKKSNNNLTLLILFILYNFIMIFLFPIKTIGFFISYFFTIIFFIITFFILRYITEKYPTKNASLYTFTYLMLLVQIIASILLSFFNILFNLSIIGNILILSIYLIIIVLLFRSTDYIEEVEEDTKNKTTFFKELQKELELIKLSDNSKNESLEKLIEDIRYSNPINNEKTIMIDSEIKKYVNALKEAVTNESTEKEINELIEILRKKIEEREIILKH